MPRITLMLAASSLSWGCMAESALFGTNEDQSAWADTATIPPEGDGDASEDLPSEEENDFATLRPASTVQYVFIANPDRDTLTRVDAQTLAVLTTPVGESPGVVLSTADQSTAVTLNEDSDDLSVIDVASLGVHTVPLRQDLNTMVMSPDGRWVACFHDRTAETPEDTSEGTQSYSEVSLVDIEALEHFPMVVGYDPHDVLFTDDSATMVVISDGWLSVVDLQADPPTPQRVAITEDLTSPPAAEEVLLSPDGGVAFVRQFGDTRLTVVDLHTLAVDSVAVGDNPTDLDISPDGTQAIAIARGSGQIWVYEIADPYQPAHTIDWDPDDVFGSITLSPDGSLGLLYSTASDRSRYAIWDRDTDTITTHGLVKQVDSVTVNATGHTAIIVHPQDDGEDVASDSPYAGAWAITLVDLATGFPHPLRLGAEPFELALSDDGGTGYAVLDGLPYVDVFDLDRLLFDEVELRSAPVHLGTMPDTDHAWISQDYETGRLSFFDPQTNQLNTLTGFELNAGIETR